MLLGERVAYPSCRGVVYGRGDKPHSASAAAPWSLKHCFAILLSHLFCHEAYVVQLHHLAYGSWKGAELGQQLCRRAAVGELHGALYVVAAWNLFHRVCDFLHLRVYAIVPTPRGNVVERECVNSVRIGKDNIIGLYTEKSCNILTYTLVGILGLFSVLYEHHIPLFSPESWYETEVVS